jgi:hypothetical protein
MNMFGSFYKSGDFAWVQDVRANFVCIHNGELAATVLSTAWEPWQVIFHFTKHASILLERFDDHQAAMSRAEEILVGGWDGVLLHPLKSRAFKHAFT